MIKPLKTTLKITKVLAVHWLPIFSGQVPDGAGTGGAFPVEDQSRQTVNQKPKTNAD